MDIQITYIYCTIINPKCIVRAGSIDGNGASEGLAVLKNYQFKIVIIAFSKTASAGDITTKTANGSLSPTKPSEKMELPLR